MSARDYSLWRLRAKRRGRGSARPADSEERNPAAPGGSGGVLAAWEDRLGILRDSPAAGVASVVAGGWRAKFRPSLCQSRRPAEYRVLPFPAVLLAGPILGHGTPQADARQPQGRFRERRRIAPFILLPSSFCFCLAVRLPALLSPLSCSTPLRLRRRPRLWITSSCRRVRRRAVIGGATFTRRTSGGPIRLATPKLQRRRMAEAA